jgi:hypothetical protein
MWASINAEREIPNPLTEHQRLTHSCQHQNHKTPTPNPECTIKIEHQNHKIPNPNPEFTIKIDVDIGVNDADCAPLPRLHVHNVNVVLLLVINDPDCFPLCQGREASQRVLEHRLGIRNVEESLTLRPELNVCALGERGTLNLSG